MQHPPEETPDADEHRRDEPERPPAREGGPDQRHIRYDYLNDAKLSKALAYWHMKRRGRSMPQKADIVPGEVKAILPNILLADALEDGTRFRCRLVGTGIVNAFGASMTGKYIGEMLPNIDDDFTQELYQTTWRERLPVFSRSTYIAAGGDSSLIVNRLLLPLSDDDKLANVIMAVLTFEYKGREPAEFGYGVQIDPSASYLEVIEDIDTIFSD
jgi:hypothetical protein